MTARNHTGNYTILTDAIHPYDYEEFSAREEAEAFANTIRDAKDMEKAPA